METVRNNQVRGTLLILLMTIAGLLLVFRTIMSFIWYQDLSQNSYTNISYYYMYGAKTLENMRISHGAFLIGFLLTGICYIIWFQRVFQNLLRSGVDHLAYNKKVIWLYWFIPLVNLYMPFKIMRDVWEDMDSMHLEEKERLHHESSFVAFYIWWVCFLLMAISHFIADVLIGIYTLPDLASTSQLYLLASVSGLLSLGGLFYMVVQIKAKEKLLFYDEADLIE